MCVCVCILHLFIILSSIASCFITFMHLYGILCTPLIIFDHLYVSRVKLSSFLYPLSIMTKMGRNCGDSFFKILHVRGRNTCLCKGEMCFILLGGVLTFFFLYTDLVTMFTYIVLIIYIYADVYLLHLPLHVLFLFSLYTYISCFCMQSIISVSHKDALMSFV